MIVLSMLVIYLFASIPQSVPIHYNIDGEIDRMGNKQELLWLIVISLSLIAGIFHFIRNPQKLNYPYPITEENRGNSYQKMQSFLGGLSLVCSFIFLMIFLNSSGILGSENYIKYILYCLLLLNPIGLIYLLKK